MKNVCDWSLSRPEGPISQSPGRHLGIDQDLRNFWSSGHKPETREENEHHPSMIVCSVLVANNQGFSPRRWFLSGTDQTIDGPIMPRADWPCLSRRLLPSQRLHRLG
jgi:hypothetical protein